MELKGNSIELSTVLKYGLTEVKKATSYMFNLVLIYLCEHNFTFNIS